MGNPLINFKLILPIGTQVVTRIPVSDVDGTVLQHRGAVGRITHAPEDNTKPYRIRFPDGTEALLQRQDLAIRKHAQRDQQALPGVASHPDLGQYVIFRCIVGSRAYGLDQSGSDIDRRGIYLPPAELHWSLRGVPEQLEDNATQELYWELQKFLDLALKANPNVLECLYTPLVELATPLTQELLAQRSIFLSQLIYQTYNGYVLSQFKKLEQHLHSRGMLKWKHVMHLIRLLLSGITVLNEGRVLVRVEEHREQLLAIRRGEMPWEDINIWRLELHREFDAAFATTRLPERPNYAQANAFLIKARRGMV